MARAKAATVAVTVEPPAPIQGSMIRLVATFTAGGLPFDPPRVHWSSRSPSGKRGKGSATKVARGVYELLDAPTLPGVWAYRIEGDGGQGIAEREVHVRPSAL
jgi:hypothetical protein